MKNLAQVIVYSAVTLLAGIIGAYAQDVYVSDQGGRVDEYTPSGSLVMSFADSGTPEGLLLSGNDLFVVNNATNAVGEYNATTGAVINSDFIENGVGGAALSSPYGIAVSGNYLFVASLGADASTSFVSEYNATTGAVINKNFLTSSSGINQPVGLDAVGGNLYVANFGNGTITEYNIATGLQDPAFSATASVNGLFGLANNGTTLFAGTLGSTVDEFNLLTGASTGTISDGFTETTGVAVSGNDLFVANLVGGVGSLTEINLTNNSEVNNFAGNVPGANNSFSFVTVASVPEPATPALLLVGGLLTVALLRRRASRI